MNRTLNPNLETLGLLTPGLTMLVHSSFHNSSNMRCPSLSATRTTTTRRGSSSTFRKMASHSAQTCFVDVPLLDTPMATKHAWLIFTFLSHGAGMSEHSICLNMCRFCRCGVRCLLRSSSFEVRVVGSPDRAEGETCIHTVSHNSFEQKQ